MKALSLIQPWATLMASGAKMVETRSWRPRDLGHGEWVAIHAAKRWTRSEIDLCRDDPLFRSLLVHAWKHGLIPSQDPQQFSATDLPRGCVVALAQFDRAVAGTTTFSYTLSPQERALGSYGPGRFAWLFTAVQPIQPVVAKGALGLWEWTPETELVHLPPVPPDAPLEYVPPPPLPR
jgi:hypothetical protein